MPYRDFLEWRIYEQIEPFGDRRRDLQTGILAATLYNMWRGKNDKAKSAKDFMIDWEKTSQREQTPEDHKRIFTLIRDAQNAVVAAWAGQLSSFG